MVIKNSNNKVELVILGITNIFFALSFFKWSIINWNNTAVINNYNERLFPWILFLILVQMISFRMKKVPFYDFGLWFVIISYFFMFGYLFRNILSLESNLVWNPIINFESNDLFHAYIFVIIALICFSFGYLVTYSNNKTLNEFNFNKTVPDKKVYAIGIIFLSIGGCARLINDLQIVFFMQSTNSYSAYSQAVGSGVLDDLAYLMLPGVFFIFFSGCINEKRKKLMFIIILIYLIIIMILTGSRKIQIFSILSLFLGYVSSLDRRNLSFKKIIIYGFFVIITLNVLITIRDNRFDLSSIGPILLDKLFSFNLFDNILGEILAETGITLLSVASIISLVPNIMMYQYGLTYLRTLPSFLPIGWLVGNFFNKASSTYVINSYTGIPVGSSFIGDLYWNWGYFGGAIVAAISGIIVSKLLRIGSSSNIRKSFAMYFSIFSQLIILVRSELFDVYRPVLLVIIMVFILEKIKFKIWRIKV